MRPHSFDVCRICTCGGTASGDASSTVLTYGDFIFASHVGTLPLGDRDADIVVADGDARVVMTLPPAFELTADATGTLHSSGSVLLRWQGADESMVWIGKGTCQTEPTYPRTPIETIDDDGSLAVSVARLEQLMERPLAGCDVDFELSRVVEGSVDDGFRADDATGIVRRTVTVTID